MSSKYYRLKALIRSSIVKNWLNLLIFSIAGGLLGSIEFPISNSDGLFSNFGEIPLIISTLFFKNPIYILLTTCAAFFISTVDPDSYFYGISTHFISLLPIWYTYHFIIKNKWLGNNGMKIIFALGSVFAYYFLLIIPFIVIREYLTVTNSSFIQLYVSLVMLLSIEIFTTTICVLLIFMYYSSYLKLKLNAEALKNRNEKLEGYAFINSHVLRAPIARIIGLSMLFNKNSQKENDDIIAKLKVSCHELDEVVKMINKYVSDENINQNQEIQAMIKDISKEYYDIVDRNNNA